MTSDEFAKNFYLEKLAFLKSCFQAQPEQPSAVNVKIKEMVCEKLAWAGVGANGN